MSSDATVAGDFLCSESEGFFGVIWSVSGDLDWYAKDLGLNNYNSELPCPYCPVGTNKARNLLPTNFGKSAIWMRMMFTALEWRAANPAARHPLFAEFAFLSILNIECDELHILYLGINQYFLGSVMKVIVFRSTDGSIDVRVASLWNKILEKYASMDIEHQFTHLSASSFLDPKKPRDTFPKLKGQGSEIKGLVDPLLEVWKDVTTTSGFDNRLLTALQALSDMQGILTEHKFDAFLPVDASKALVVFTDIFLREYSAIGVMADNMTPPQFLFSGAPKLHWLWHMSYRSHFLNPRRVATFSGEDFVKHQKNSRKVLCVHQIAPRSKDRDGEEPIVVAFGESERSQFEIKYFTRLWCARVRSSKLYLFMH